MRAGEHIAVVSTAAANNLWGRYNGWEVRDTFLVLTPGPTNFFICLLRTTLEESTIAKQVLKTGTGALNIEVCRVGSSKRVPVSPKTVAASTHTVSMPGLAGGSGHDPNIGRWPPNLLLIHHPKCSHNKIKNLWGCLESCPVKSLDKQTEIPFGGASRFFPQFQNLPECLDWVNRLINA